METEVKKLEDLLDKIWRLGDRDEMSIKHIGHALASIVVGDYWSNGDDYNLPNYYDDDENGSALEKLGKLTASIDPYWTEVEELCGELGSPKFLEVVKASKFGFYPLSYLTDSWLSYYDRLDEEVKQKLGKLLENQNRVLDYLNAQAENNIRKSSV